MTLKVGSLSIEWDARKNSINAKKHGIRFEDAAFVFLDKNRVEVYDIKHSHDEDRYIVIGIVEDVLFVVYTERIGSIRIISARKATSTERKLYYGKNS